MRRSVVGGVLVSLLALCAWSTSPAAGQSPCVFQLGFAELQSVIPDVVGACVDDEVHDARTGDGLQPTTHGLLVWRKSDQSTAFTNGTRSWLNGPLGLQHRQNDQRLWWEANPDGLAIVPPPEPGQRCHTAGLSLEPGRVDAGAGNLVGTFRFTNNLDVACTFFGYPGAQLLDEVGNPVQTTLVRAGGYFVNNPPPAVVAVSPHAAALFRIHWEQVPVGDETTCSMAASIAITPPDEYVPLPVAALIRACGGGHLDISRVESDTAG